MARRTDGTHRPVIDTLRKVGWTVLDCSQLGRGAPDAICARGGVLKMIEIKDGRLSPSRRRLTPDEAKVHAAFKAAGVPVVILTSVEDAVNL